MLSRQLSARVPEEHQNLLLWRDPKKSGLYFGSATFAYILLAWAPISFFVLGLQGFTVLMATTLLWNLGGNALGRPGPPVPDVLLGGIDESQLNELAQRYRPLVNLVLVVAGQLLSGRNPALSLKVIASGAVLSWIAARVSLLTVAYLIIFLAFTVPKVYEMKQKEIDNVLNLAKDKLHDVYKILDDKVLKKVHKGKPAGGVKQQ